MVDYDGPNKASHVRPARLSFREIVGQEDLKQGLLAVATDDDLDGLLVRGEKGTAKSTAVRALGELLPARPAVEDCPYGCHPTDSTLQCERCRGRSDPPTTERPPPVVTLPLGATRERVVGTLSVADALAGDYEFDPGLLARAHRGILYVDEVNLLDDHLVDVLLDAAVAGVNRVERDGVSVVHPAEFTLVGTMNPEEGDLRPQLRDRFAISTTVEGCRDVADRVTIVERALGADAESEGDSSPRDDDRPPAERLATARDRLPSVTLPRSFLERIAACCRDAGVDGHRADVATARTARTLAALAGRTKVLESDCRQAAAFALPHRLRSGPFEDAPDLESILDEHFERGDDGTPEDGDGERSGSGDEEAARRDSLDDRRRNRSRPGAGDGDGDRGGDPTGGPQGGEPEKRRSGGPEPDGSRADDRSRNGGTDGEGPTRGDGPSGDREGSNADGGESRDGEERRSGGGGGSGDGERGRSAVGGGSPDENEDESAPGAGRGADEPLIPGGSAGGAPPGDATAPDLEPEAVVDDDSGDGGSRVRTTPDVGGTGPRVRTRRTASTADVDVSASVRAAAARGADGLEARDLRESVRAGETSALVLFVVDASASMRPAMRAAKGTVLELLEDAYQHRDRVGVVAFAGEGAEVVLPPTDSVALAARHLKDLPTGDRTPLPAGLRTACEVIHRADPATAVVVLVTDGRANVADGSPVEATGSAAAALAELGAHVVVVDAGDGRRGGLTRAIAETTGGRLIPIDALSAERVDGAVGAARETQV